MAGRKIRDERDARRCLAAAQRTGLSRTEWAKQHGVDGRSLFGWVRKLDRGKKVRGTEKRGRKKRQEGLVELIPKARHKESRYVIRYGQLAVEIGERFDEATLARLLKVIAAC
jgi:transposase-like protein